jgi:hypothetical protein
MHEHAPDIRIFTCIHIHDSWLASVQFESAKLSVYDNKWSEVYDFTPGEGNWSFLPHNTKASDMMKPLADVEGTFVTKEEQEQHSDDSVVPVTVGLRKSDYAGQERAFILMLPAGVGAGPTLMSKLPEDCVLIQTKQMQLDAAKVRCVCGPCVYTRVCTCIYIYIYIYVYMCDTVMTRG